jgi:hypothetical protein
LTTITAIVMMDFIRSYGAMQGLVSDNSLEQTSVVVDDILRLYCIKDRQSEPYFHHQNPAERKIQDVKRVTNNILDRLGIPDEYWLLTMLFVIDLFNVLANRHGEIPLEMLTNQTVDISAYLSFHFWEEVFVSVDPDEKFAHGATRFRTGIPDHEAIHGVCLRTETNFPDAPGASPSEAPARATDSRVGQDRERAPARCEEGIMSSAPSAIDQKVSRVSPQCWMLCRAG